MASRSISPAASMSVLDALGGHDGPSKTVMAEMPVVVQPPTRPGKQKSPQERLDRFWKKFTTEAPGKATAVIPQNKTTAKAAKGRTNVVSSSGKTTTQSYEEAAAICRAKVEKIVKECRRINQKYRDPHFDLEFDLKMSRRDCLDPLDNTVREVESSSDESVGRRRRHRHQRSRSQSRRRRRRRRGHTGPLADMNEEASDVERKALDKAGRETQKETKARKSMPKDNEGQYLFKPQAVKRVGEIFDEPTFYIDGPTANDVRQGRDGDCWLMAALCTLSNKPGLIERICVARDEAVGVYGFVFHRDGDWISEIIDDKLYLTKPDYDEVNVERMLWEDRDRVNSEETYRKTYQANSGALYFAQCEHPNETWLPLLEKAYAKAHGDYAAIEGGFTGEGIEDLTGGVTSELFTTDILDKEYFWKEELMEVNAQFLFGCSTGVWGRGWGDRKGILELHAYSVMRAVEMDGERLVLLKNPWGKGEWNGPWSDGSKEWTPEWLQKLNHRFGDDGAFWISYEDLLRKYQAFDRTRLFGPDWKVTTMWTTLSVPWTLEYHDTKFAFILTKPGPVVLVLSQLDDRYFRGLEGQYRFGLSFRLHHAGEEDYVVRSQTIYRMNRSVNVELELEAGEYHVLVKIDAMRDTSIMSAEAVVRANAKVKREKLIRIGLAYDVAHSKGKIVESPEEKAAREAYEKWKRDKEKKELKERIMKDRVRSHYIQVKRLAKNRKAMEKRKAKQKAREEKARAEEEKLMAKRGLPQLPPPGMGMGMGGSHVVVEDLKRVRQPEKKDVGSATAKERRVDAQVQTEEQPTSPGLAHELGTTATDDSPSTESKNRENNHDAKNDSMKDSESSAGPGENTPATTFSEKSVDDVEGTPTDASSTPRSHQQRATVESTPLKATPAASEAPKDTAVTESVPKPQSATPKARDGAKPSETDINRQQEPIMSAAPLKQGDMSQEESFHSANQDPTSSTSSGAYTSESEMTDGLVRNPNLRSSQHKTHPSRNRLPGNQRRPGPPRMPPSGGRLPPPGMRPPPAPGYHGPPSPPNNYVSRRMGMAMPMRGQPPPPTPRAFISDNESLSSISSPSDISDRELEYHLEDQKSRTVRVPLQAPPLNRLGGYISDSDLEVERDPWNAVAVVGFRVYYKVDGNEAKEGEEEETVKIKVIRPVWFPVEKDGETDKEKVLLEGKVKETGMDESMVLDLDDSAKDATLQGGEKVEVEGSKDVKEEAEKEEDRGDVVAEEKKDEKQEDLLVKGDADTKDAKYEEKNSNTQRATDAVTGI